ncbi:MAG: hypothetical protein WCA13_12775, partial [Terriglobales bacterium]
PADARNGATGVSPVHRRRPQWSDGRLARPSQTPAMERRASRPSIADARNGATGVSPVHPQTQPMPALRS